MTKVINEKNFKIKKGEFLESGDIVYISNQQMSLNQDLIGDDSDLSGEDIIVIIDDFGDGTDTHTFYLINGGFEILIDNNDYYYVIGHYSSIVKHCNNYEPSVIDKMMSTINHNILNN